jgi:hypothetical protein
MEDPTAIISAATISTRKCSKSWCKTQVPELSYYKIREHCRERDRATKCAQRSAEKEKKAKVRFNHIEGKSRVFCVGLSGLDFFPGTEKGSGRALSLGFE